MLPAPSKGAPCPRPIRSTTPSLTPQSANLRIVPRRQLPYAPQTTLTTGLPASSQSTRRSTKARVSHPSPTGTTPSSSSFASDAHAGHWHRQVSFLAAESIQTAQARGLDVHEGDFGENFTTQGINLLSLPLGTQIKIGNEVLVEISQIGKVCHTRCAIYYLAGDCIFPHEGIFGVVLQGGEAHTGDDIQVVKLGDGTCSFTPAEALKEVEQARREGTL